MGRKLGEKIYLKKGCFYKVREYYDDRAYTIICPNEDREVGNLSIWGFGKYLGCIFYIRGAGKKSYLSHKREIYVPHIRINNCIRAITKKDYIKIQSVLKKNNFIYNKKAQELIKIKNG